jgi:hypothetical protein
MLAIGGQISKIGRNFLLLLKQYFCLKGKSREKINKIIGVVSTLTGSVESGNGL